MASELNCFALAALKIDKTFTQDSCLPNKNSFNSLYFPYNLGTNEACNSENLKTANLNPNFSVFLLTRNQKMDFRCFRSFIL